MSTPPPDYLTALHHLRTLTEQGERDMRHQQLWSNAEIIRHYLHSFRLDNADHSYTAMYVNDALPRFLHTLDMLPFEAGLRVLELGSNPYLFTILVQRFHDYDIHLANFTGTDIYDTRHTETDQRIWSDTYQEDYTFTSQQFNLELSDYPYPDDHFDLILFCEILEHLVINPLAVFDKLRRIIKPGGLLLVTTPNAVRFVNVALMLAGSNVFDRYHPEYGVYGRHNREFTIEEMQRILTQAGFRPRILHTLDRYDYHRTRIIKDTYEESVPIPYTRALVEAWLTWMGMPLDNRGDNIYALAERVA